MLDRLVGVSHECDWPPEVVTRPRVTHCPIHGQGLSSAEVDAWVSRTLAEQGTLYRLDEDRIRALAPDVILTQQLCDVCAVDHGSVAAFARTLPSPPRVVNLDPSSLDEILGDHRTVAAALGEPERGEAVVAGLRRRIDAVAALAAAQPERPRCVVLEWLDPLFAAGHWTPELVTLAGGVEPCGTPHVDSARLDWEAVVAAAPDVLVLAACGQTAERALEDLPRLRERPGWDTLPAVRSGRVHAVDANAWFARPGPRTVDTLEILAALIHPRAFGGRFPDRGVRTVRA